MLRKVVTGSSAATVQHGAEKAAEVPCPDPKGYAEVLTEPVNQKWAWSRAERPQDARYMGLKSVVGASDFHKYKDTFPKEPEVLSGTLANTNAWGKITTSKPCNGPGKA